MTTTVSMRNNPDLYLHPITKQLYPDGKSYRNCRDPHVSASARSQNHPSTHQFANPIIRTTPRGSTSLNLAHKIAWEDFGGRLEILTTTEKAWKMSRKMKQHREKCQR